jgi:integrase
MASIKRRPDGKWRARYRDDQGREHSKHFDRKVEGETWLAAQTVAVATGAHVVPRLSRITVQAFYDDWSRRQVWASGTRTAMDLAMRSSGLGGYQLGRVSHSHIEAWIKRMADQPLAAGTIKTRYNNVRGVFRAAVRDRLIVRDPTEAVRLPRQRRADASMTIPTVQEVGTLLVAADDSFRAFVALCAFAGLRLGEAAAIQVADIDFLRRQLAVSRQVQRAGERKIEIKAPKYGSERVIHLPDELATLLGQHVEAHSFSPAADRWLFQGEPGDPPHQNTVGYWWRKTQTAAGLSGIRLHDLRHFYASGLIAAGCDVVTVQRALGHASATTTLRTYAHLWPTAEDRTRAAAADLMRSATSLGNSADFLRTRSSK